MPMTNFPALKCALTDRGVANDPGIGLPTHVTGASPRNRERSTKKFLRAAWAGLALFGALALPSLASAATLKIGGTGSAMEMLRQIGPAFTADTGITLEVIPSLGTTGGNAALVDGVLGMSVAGRELKERDTSKGLTVAATMRTPYGFVTSRPGPDGLRSAEIVGIYSADKPTWPDGRSIHLFLRSVDDSDNLLLGRLFPGLAEAIVSARTRSDLPVLATDQDNADAAEKTEGSLVGATLVQIVTEKRRLRFVAIDGVAATMANYENGSYPYGRTLHLVVPAKVSPEAASFLAFIASPAGEAIMRTSGMIAGAK
jgi:phosphate transport system substrate-binding protein